MTTYLEAKIAELDRRLKELDPYLFAAQDPEWFYSERLTICRNYFGRLSILKSGLPLFANIDLIIIDLCLGDMSRLEVYLRILNKKKNQEYEFEKKREKYWSERDREFNKVLFDKPKSFKF